MSLNVTKCHKVSRNVFNCHLINGKTYFIIKIVRVPIKVYSFVSPLENTVRNGGVFRLQKRAFYEI